jgi:hypothetical protein
MEHILLSITDDAWEYMKLLQQSLLAEVEQQLEDNDNYHYQFKNTITSYWDMFSHG